MPFSELTDEQLPEELRPAVAHLLDLKMNGPEKLQIEPIAEINDYLERRIKELDAFLTRPELLEPEKREWDLLDRFFLKEIG